MSHRFLSFILILALSSAAFPSYSIAKTTQQDRSAASAESSSDKAPKTSKRVRSEAGLNIPAWGVAVDAVYDPRLDDLIPGYKIINIILTNRSASSINLDPQKDRWAIRDNLGKLEQGINHVRLISERLWNDLPVGLKHKLEYPSSVRVGYSTKIDIFFPKGVELSNFREIIWRSNHFQKEFNIYTMTGKESDAEKEERIPSSPSPTYEQAKEKYEGVQVKPEEEPAVPPEDKKKKRSPFDPELDNLTIPMD